MNDYYYSIRLLGLVRLAPLKSELTFITIPYILDISMRGYRKSRFTPSVEIIQIYCLALFYMKAKLGPKRSMLKSGQIHLHGTSAYRTESAPAVVVIAGTNWRQSGCWWQSVCNAKSVGNHITGYSSYTISKWQRPFQNGNDNETMKIEEGGWRALSRPRIDWKFIEVNYYYM